MRRLDGDLDRRRLELAEHPQELARFARDDVAGQRCAGLVEHRELRDLAVQLHAEVDHRLGLPCCWMRDRA
jgi:hypothetical protein